MSASIMDTLRPKVISTEAGRTELKFTVRPELTIPGGQLQGGIVAAMLDMSMAMAAGGGIATASLQMDILRPAMGPELTVVGTITRKGRRIVFADGEMRNAAGDLVARGRQTAVPISFEGSSEATTAS